MGRLTIEGTGYHSNYSYTTDSLLLVPHEIHQHARYGQSFDSDCASSASNHNVSPARSLMLTNSTHYDGASLSRSKTPPRQLRSWNLDTRRKREKKEMRWAAMTRQWYRTHENCNASMGCERNSTNQVGSRQPSFQRSCTFVPTTGLLNAEV